MKRTIFALLLMMLSYNVLSAIPDTVGGNDGQSASIVFFRVRSYYASGLKMTIMANEKAVTKLKNASFFEFITPPGAYYFSSNMGSEVRIKLDVEAGKTYYVRAYISPGFWTGHPQLELVDEAVGKSVIDGGSLTKLAYEDISFAPKNSRIGLQFGVGGGFETIDLFIDDDGNDISLSTGGGVNIGAKYGYSISKHFDFSAEWLYQNSSLSRPLKNAKSTFNRMVIRITPALVIPIKNGDYYRFRLGAGVGMYSLGSMRIDASKIPGGEKLTFKYKPSLGAHASFDFEFNFSENASMSMGFTYYNVQYNFKNEGSTHFSTEDLFNQPDGSGIDFNIGYFYRF